MPKADYIKPNDLQFSEELQTFNSSIGAHATTLGITPAQIVAQAADAAYFAQAVASQNILLTSASQWTAWKNIVRLGGVPPESGAATAPTLPAAVPAVAPGVEERFRALAQSIKKHASYNAAIGEALGIEGDDTTAPVLTDIQPQLTVKISGGRVEIGWGWQGKSAFLDLCEIEVDRADGKGFVLLTFDTTPGYVDTAAFPATPAKWSYRAIYRVDDARVGQWSSPISINVG